MPNINVTKAVSFDQRSLRLFRGFGTLNSFRVGFSTNEVDLGLESSNSFDGETEPEAGAFTLNTPSLVSASFDGFEGCVCAILTTYIQAST